MPLCSLFPPVRPHGAPRLPSRRAGGTELRLLVRTVSRVGSQVGAGPSPRSLTRHSAVLIKWKRNSKHMEPHRPPPKDKHPRVPENRQKLGGQRREAAGLLGSWSGWGFPVRQRQKGCSRCYGHITNLPKTLWYKTTVYPVPCSGLRNLDRTQQDPAIQDAGSWLKAGGLR